MRRRDGKEEEENVRQREWMGDESTPLSPFLGTRRPPRETEGVDGEEEARNGETHSLSAHRILFDYVNAIHLSCISIVCAIYICIVLSVIVI